MSDGNVITTVAGFTDVGSVRTNNEDNFLIADLATGRVYLIPQRVSHQVNDNRILLAVSDGVGGASSGEVASSMAVHSMRVELLRRNTTSASPFERLVQAVEKANTLIWNEGQSNPDRKGMGATITAALIEKNIVYIAEVGDSRGYVIHNGRIKQITTDQSLVGVLVNRGLMTPEQAETAPGRNIILQSLGCQAEIKVAVSSMELSSGDCLLLCSDGLSGKVKAEEMMQLVENASTIEESCRQLIDLANKRGGEDNITVVVAKFEGDGLKTAENVSRLTTNIEVLAAFDPEGESNRKSKRQDSGKVKPKPESSKLKKEDDPGATKKLSSEKSKGVSSFTHTLGSSSNLLAQELSELTTQKIQPEKYTRAQLLAKNNDADVAINAAMAALRSQLDCFRHMVFWAEKEGKNTQSLIDSVKKLEQFLKNIEAQRISLADLNSLAEKLTE